MTPVNKLGLVAVIAMLYSMLSILMPADVSPLRMIVYFIVLVIGCYLITLERKN